jgi:hypothetical protein
MDIVGFRKKCGKSRSKYKAKKSFFFPKTTIKRNKLSTKKLKGCFSGVRRSSERCPRKKWQHDTITKATKNTYKAKSGVKCQQRVFN